MQCWESNQGLALVSYLACESGQFLAWGHGRYWHYSNEGRPHIQGGVHRLQRAAISTQSWGDLLLSSGRGWGGRRLLWAAWRKRQTEGTRYAHSGLYPLIGCVSFPWVTSLMGTPKEVSMRQRIRVTQRCRKVYGPGQNSRKLAQDFLEHSAEDRSLKTRSDQRKDSLYSKPT